MQPLNIVNLPNFECTHMYHIATPFLGVYDTRDTGTNNLNVHLLIQLCMLICCAELHGSALESSVCRLS